jgi:hypothetical protein
LRIPHCLCNQLTDGSEAVSLTCQRHSTTQKSSFSVSDTHFCYSWSKPQGLVWLKVLGKLKQFNDLIRFQTGKFLACRIVPQPTTLQNTDDILMNFTPPSPPPEPHSPSNANTREHQRKEHKHHIYNDTITNSMGLSTN